MNPKWIAGVKRHGYKGAFEIAATVDYMYAFAATTGAVKSHHFDLVYSAYIDDDQTRGFIEENNAPALREMAARLLEALERDLWRPRLNSTRRTLEMLCGAARPDGDGWVMTDDLERHKIKMAKKKVVRDKIMATKTEEKGLVIVHTGKGKGKSSRRSE